MRASVRERERQRCAREGRGLAALFSAMYRKEKLFLVPKVP
jgi:hypothetical protein